MVGRGLVGAGPGEQGVGVAAGHWRALKQCEQ